MVGLPRRLTLLLPLLLYYCHHDGGVPEGFRLAWMYANVLDCHNGSISNFTIFVQLKRDLIKDKTAKYSQYVTDLGSESNRLTSRFDVCLSNIRVCLAD